MAKKRKPHSKFGELTDFEWAVIDDLDKIFEANRLLSDRVRALEGEIEKLRRK